MAVKPKTPPPPPTRGKATSPKPSTALATQRAPQNEPKEVGAAMADMITQDLGSGMEDINLQDMAVPRIGILQSLSPQLDKRNDAAYIEDAEVGMIFDSVSGRIWPGDKGVLMVLVNYKKDHVEWDTKAKRGQGFVRSHGEDPSIMASTQRDERTGMALLKNAPTHEIVPTAQYFAILVDEDSPGVFHQYFLSMSKTQLIKARKLNTIARTFTIAHAGKQVTPALFYRAYRFTTIPESNDKGNWFGWKIEPEGNTLDIEPEGEAIYLAARNFQNSIRQGKVKVTAPGDDPNGGAATGEDAPM